MNELWVIFDGTEPDSEVVGLATSIESAIYAVSESVYGGFDRSTCRIEFPHSDSATIKARVVSMYDASKEPYIGTWLLRKYSVYN